MNCKDITGNNIKIGIILLWTIISIFISVKGTYD